jgi:hypothetical protein
MESDLITNVIRCFVASLHTVSTFELCIWQKLLSTLSSLSPFLNWLSLLLPTLDGRTLPCWFYGTWVWLGCCLVDLTQSLGSPLSNTSYLVAPLVVDVSDLEAWYGVGSSNGSVGPPLGAPLLHLIQWSRTSHYDPLLWEETTDYIQLPYVFSYGVFFTYMSGFLRSIIYGRSFWLSLNHHETKLGSRFLSSLFEKQFYFHLILYIYIYIY